MTVLRWQWWCCYCWSIWLRRFRFLPMFPFAAPKIGVCDDADSDADVCVNVTKTLWMTSMANFPKSNKAYRPCIKYVYECELNTIDLNGNFPSRFFHSVSLPYISLSLSLSALILSSFILFPCHSDVRMNFSLSFETMWPRLFIQSTVQLIAKWHRTIKWIEALSRSGRNE